ncbi:MAG: hypothetical protein ACRD4F_16340, partial [Candidatus Angelobacter sp.]
GVVVPILLLLVFAISIPYAAAQSQPAVQPQPSTSTSQPQQTPPSTAPVEQPSPSPSPSSNPVAQPSSSTTPVTQPPPAAGVSPQPNAQPQTTATISSGTTIPPGTLISITPTQPIQNPQVGSTYPAQISQNVTGTNGSVLIPAGTPAQLTVANAVSPTGATELALALKSVTVNGQTYNVSTNQGQGQATGQSQAANGSQPKALSPSIGGLLGTLVQVMGANQQAGGASQQTATQGALGSGALSSILGKILTHGATVNVPSQSQLTFRLDQPLQLQ